MLTILWRRMWFIVLTTGLAALVAWLTVRDDPRLYERSYSFLLRPNPALDRNSYGDALSVIQREDTSVEATILGLLDSEAFLETIASEAGQRSAGIRLRPTIRPGSDVIDVSIRGRDRRVLAQLGEVLAPEAQGLVTGNYNDTYVLEPVGVVAPSDPVSPDVLRSLRLGLVLGAAAAVLIVLAEAWAAARRGVGRRGQRATA